jgi:hypothetical protein
MQVKRGSKAGDDKFIKQKPDREGGLRRMHETSLTAGFCLELLF